MVYATFRFSCLSKQGSRLGETLIFKNKRPPFEGSVACLPGSENRNESKPRFSYTFELNHTQRMPTKRRALQRACYFVFLHGKTTFVPSASKKVWVEFRCFEASFPKLLPIWDQLKFPVFRFTSNLHISIRRLIMDSQLGDSTSHVCFLSFMGGFVLPHS